VIGSCHPVSSAQLRQLADVTGEAPLLLDGRPTATAAARIAACLRATLPGLPPPSTLIAAGGKTL